MGLCDRRPTPRAQGGGNLAGDQRVHAPGPQAGEWVHRATGRRLHRLWMLDLLGVFPQPGENKANGRSAIGVYGHGWGFAWPADRRILYNRAAARPDGTPW